MSEVKGELFLGQPLTEKFYTNRVKEEKKNNDIIQEKLDKFVVKGPKEKFEKPITENQRKGPKKFLINLT